MLIKFTKLGSLKREPLAVLSKYQLAPDFDAPLDDFKEYMP